MSTKSHTLWLMAALAAPAAHASGCGWFSALLAAAVLLPLTVLPADWENMSRPYGLLQLLWLGLVTGGLLRNAAVYWPSNNDLAVPLTLLVLAGLTDSDAAGRIGTVLAFCLLILAVPVCCSAAGKLRWIRPSAVRWPMELSVVLLLPALPTGTRRERQILPLLALTVGLSLLSQGILSSGVAAALPDGFYQMARTLGHMEPIVSAAMTLSYFAMTCQFVAAGSAIAQSGNLTRWIVPVVAGGCIVAGVEIYHWVPFAVSLVLWVFLPLMKGLLRRKTAAQKES